jgi:putative membrane protein
VDQTQGAPLDTTARAVRPSADDRQLHRAARRALLATVALTALLYAVLGYALTLHRPTAPGPAVAAFLAAAPTVIALVNATALVCLLRGYRAIRAHRVATHRRAMLAAAACITAFLVLYVARVVLGGVKPFPGPGAVRTYVYLPVLTVHIALSILSVPLVVYNLLVGLTFDLRDVRRSAHVRVGRLAVLLWSVSLSLGIVVYVLLNLLY